MVHISLHAFTSAHATLLQVLLSIQRCDDVNKYHVPEPPSEVDVWVKGI